MIFADAWSRIRFNLIGDLLILLAEEPTANLDSTSGKAVMGLLRKLRRGGATAGGATLCMAPYDPSYARHAGLSINRIDGKVAEEHHHSWEIYCDKSETLSSREGI
jgi:ABC-type lipoprotein export system ATPase subunit